MHLPGIPKSHDPPLKVLVGRYVNRHDIMSQIVLNQ